MSALTQRVYALLLLYISLFGAHNICIVTNAKHSWFTQSCRLYNEIYQKIRCLLRNISVISAFDLYHSQKHCAFMDLLRNKYGINRVICIGDSEDEYTAIDSVCDCLRTSANIKRSINYFRFKLLESPSLNAMIKQLTKIERLDYSLIATQSYDQSFTFH